MLWSLAGLAPLALLASELPRAWAWPLALVACAWGIFDARRHRAQPRRNLLVPAGRGVATCDGVRIDGLRVGWRGPLAFLQWRDGDGRRQRAAFWPDTLDAGMRRELKVAMLRRDAARDAASMAG
jgi:toxin CptA